MGEAAPVELVEVDVVARAAERAAEDVADALAAQGGQAAHPAQVAGDPVVDLLGGEVLQLRVVQEAFGHPADLHLAQPAVDDVVGGDVEEVGVADAAAVAVAQGGVQHLVGEDEPPFLVVESAQRVDVDLGRAGVDGGDGDAVGAGEFGVGDEGDAGRDAAEEGVGGDEPVQRPFPGLESGGSAAHRGAPAACHVHRHGDGAGEGVGEVELPVGGLAALPGVPGHEQLVRFAARRTAALVEGRDAVAAPAGGELVLVAARVGGGQVLGGDADGEAEQEAVDDGAVGREGGTVGLDAELRGRRDVAEAQVDDAVRDRPRPLGGFGPAGGVDVQHAVGIDAYQAGVGRGGSRRGGRC